MKNTLFTAFATVFLTTGCSGLDLAAAFNPTITSSAKASEILNLDRIDASNATLIAETEVEQQSFSPLAGTALQLTNCGVGTADVSIAWQEASGWWKGPTHCSAFTTLDPIPPLEKDDFFKSVESIKTLKMDVGLMPSIKIHYDGAAPSPDEIFPDNTLYVWGYGATMLFTHPEGLYEPIWAITSSTPQSTLETWYRYDYGATTDTGDPNVQVFTKDFALFAKSDIHILGNQTLDDLRIMLMYNGETEVQVAAWAILGKNNFYDSWSGPDNLGSDDRIESISFELSTRDLEMIADPLQP